MSDVGFRVVDELRDTFRVTGIHNLSKDISGLRGLLFLACQDWCREAMKRREDNAILKTELDAVQKKQQDYDKIG